MIDPEIERVTDTETEGAIDNEMVTNRKVVEAVIRHVEEPATDNETRGVIHLETDLVIDPKIKEAVDMEIHQGMLIDPMTGLETGGVTDQGPITVIDHETGVLLKAQIGCQTKTMVGVSLGNTLGEIRLEVIRVKTKAAIDKLIKEV